MIQNSINQNFFTVDAGLYLPNMIYVNANSTILTSGQNNLYTVPSNRRAMIFGIYCNSQGSVGAVCNFQNSSTYYNGGGPSVALSAGITQNIISIIPLILEAGEILSIYLSSAVSVNVWPQILEFDSSSNVKSCKTLGLPSGLNLCYTCPAGKTALLLDTKFNFGGASATAFSILPSGSTQCFLCYVPNGQSPSVNYRITNIATPSSIGGGGTAVQSASRGPSLNAGDMIYCNASNATGACALFNVVEF